MAVPDKRNILSIQFKSIARMGALKGCRVSDQPRYAARSGFMTQDSFHREYAAEGERTHRSVSFTSAVDTARRTASAVANVAGSAVAECKA